MKSLKIMIVMLILIMSVGAVCAAENITEDSVGDGSQDILETVQGDITTDDSSDILETAQNDIYTASEGSFTNLTDEITETINSTMKPITVKELLLGMITSSLTVMDLQLMLIIRQEHLRLLQRM